MGESVYGGGGYFSVSDVKRLAGNEAAQLAAKCVDNQYGEIAIVNNYDDAIDADRANNPILIRTISSGSIRL